MKRSFYKIAYKNYKGEEVLMRGAQTEFFHTIGGIKCGRKNTFHNSDLSKAIAEDKVEFIEYELVEKSRTLFKF